MSLPLYYAKYIIIHLTQEILQSHGQKQLLQSYKKKEKTPYSILVIISLLYYIIYYKILTSILATRIQNYTKKLIKPDQTGFIIGHNGRELNLQSIAARDRTPSMLLSLDAEKAFDRVDWLFLEQTLLEMGFGETFATWINVLYKNPRSKVRVNGCCSNSFNVEKGGETGRLFVTHSFCT